MSEELSSSELGTQEYWDKRYKQEIRNFRSHGDVGDIWFGEDIVDRVVSWIQQQDFIKKTDPIVDIGCGNGMTLIELSSSGYENLTGLDYSEGAVRLAREIAESHGSSGIQYEVQDVLQPVQRKEFKIVHDKGTYDAISLSENAKENRAVYAENVHKLLGTDGLFVIASCNWTQEELEGHFVERFQLFSAIPTPQFKFGGKVGNVVTCLVFQKKSS